MREEDGHPTSQRERPGTEGTSILNSSFQPPNCEMINFCCVSHPTYSTLLQQSQQTNIPCFPGHINDMLRTLKYNINTFLAPPPFRKTRFVNLLIRRYQSEVLQSLSTFFSLYFRCPSNMLSLMSLFCESCSWLLSFHWWRPRQGWRIAGKDMDMVQHTSQGDCTDRTQTLSSGRISLGDHRGSRWLFSDQTPNLGHTGYKIVL